MPYAVYNYSPRRSAMDGSGSGFPHGTRHGSGTSLQRARSPDHRALGHLTAATYRFLLLVAEFDRREATYITACQHRALVQLAMRHRHGRGAREGPCRARARAPSRSQRGIREWGVLVFEGARDRARRNTRERVGAAEHALATARRRTSRSWCANTLGPTARRREERAVAAA